MAGVALTIVLGFWQLGRAEQKLTLQQRIEEFARSAPIAVGSELVNPADVLLRPLEVKGRFDPAHAVFLDNRIYKQRPGLHVLMPLRIGDSNKYLLVNRGWIAVNMDRRKAPVVKTPEGEVTLRGMAAPYSEHYLELSSKSAEGNVWQNIVLERYRQATRLDVQPVILQQTSALDDGLVRDWPPVDLRRNVHLAYAVQWFGMAVAIFIYYVVVNVRRSEAT
jgi:surfeit locus 1 family protein